MFSPSEHRATMATHANVTQPFGPLPCAGVLLAMPVRPESRAACAIVLTACPSVLTNRRAMTTDVLSDVLRAVRLTGAVYFDFDLTAPWVAEAPPSREIAGVVMPGSQRVIEYHLMAEGAAWGHAVGEPPIRLREGDLLVFPQGDAHVLSSAPGMRAAPDLAMYARPSTPLPLMYELGGGGAERARIICGFLGCDERPYNPLLTALPSVIHLTAGDRKRPRGRSARCSTSSSANRGAAIPAPRTCWRGSRS